MKGNPATTNWQIAYRGIISGPIGIINTNVLWFLLQNRDLPYAWVVTYNSLGIGTGAAAVPYVICNYAPFTTGSLCSPTDFNSFGSIKFGANSVGDNTAVALNFYSVDHHPNPINITGTPVGAGEAVGLTVGRFAVLTDMHVSADSSSSGAPVAMLFGAADSGDYGGLVAPLDDSADSLDDITSAIADYLQNNTDPNYFNYSA